MEDILLSVIVPIHNTREYLENCIQSLVNQTFESMEIILIDDGSNDNSLSICEKFERKYSNIRVYSKSYTGVGATRNYGIPLAKGKYIGFVDSDDFIDKNMYKSLVEEALNNECEICVCGYEEVYNDSNIGELKIDNKWRILTDNNKIIQEYLLLKITTFVWDKIYKKDFLLKYNLLFEEGCYYEDINMVLKCLYNCEKIAINESKYYKYNQRNGSIMHSRTEKHLSDYKCEIGKFYSFIYDNYNIEEIKLELRNSKFRLTYNLLKMIKDMKQEYKLEKYFEKFDKPIILFGASKAGKLILDYFKLFNIKVMYFCDNNISCLGEKIDNIEIICPKNLLNIDIGKYNVYIASMYYNQIYNQLLDFDLEKQIIDLDIF